MAIPSTGQLNVGMINVEIKRASTAPFNMNDSDVRKLAGKPTSGSAISFADFRGKSFLPPVLPLGFSIDPVQGFITNAYAMELRFNKDGTIQIWDTVANTKSGNAGRWLTGTNTMEPDHMQFLTAKITSLLNTGGDTTDKPYINDVYIANNLNVNKSAIDSENAFKIGVDAGASPSTWRVVMQLAYNDNNATPQTVSATINFGIFVF